MVLLTQKKKGGMFGSRMLSVFGSNKGFQEQLRVYVIR